MTTEERNSVFHHFTQEMEFIMASKSHDYATEDVLSNFKLVAQITKLTPEQVIMVFIATKTVRLGNLLGQEAKNESLRDNLLDLSNYNILLEMVRKEQII